MLRNRKYKSGTQYCLWRWTDVDSEYITRLHVIKTPWWAICVHWIRKPDPEPYLHDHPVSFLSIIPRGWYIERRNGKLVMRDWWNFIRAKREDKHTIIACEPNTITICFMGPKVREWGFHGRRAWIMWKDYYAIKRAGGTI